MNFPTCVTNGKEIPYRHKYRVVKLPDAIIAATALVYNLTLVTRNTVDFRNISGLELVNPWEIKPQTGRPDGSYSFIVRFCYKQLTPTVQSGWIFGFSALSGPVDADRPVCNHSKPQRIK